MASELERRFFDDELNEFVRGLLLAEIDRRHSGRAEFTFNVVDVLLDFDERTATLEDVLAAGGEAVLPLDDFIVRLRSSGRRPGG